LALDRRNLIVFGLQLNLPLVVLRQQLVVGVDLLLKLLLQPLRLLAQSVVLLVRCTNVRWKKE